MSEGELQAKLADWLESSGRALELRTARMLRSKEAVRRVAQSTPYEDVNTKQQREGDVLAIFHWLTSELAVAAELAIECKSGKSNPWVAFYDGHRHTPLDLKLWGGTAGEWPPEYREKFMETWLWSESLVTDRVATHAVSAFGKDSNNHAQDAARQALSFARARVKSGTTRYVGDPEHLTSVSAIMPVVVTQAPLFDCELKADGEVSLTQVERFDMWIHLGRYDRRRVYVRSESGLVEMASGLASLRENLAFDL